MNDDQKQNADIRRIQSMIAAGFPKPPEIPPLPPEATKEQRQHKYDLEVAQFFDGLAHRAVNVNEKRGRDWMKLYAIDWLLHNRPLPSALRAWLIYVLGAMDDLPHKSKGAPVKGFDSLVFKNQLASYIAKTGHPIPRGHTEKRLRAAADHLCTSYETVRAAFYDKDFKGLIDLFKN